MLVYSLLKAVYLAYSSKYLSPTKLVCVCVSCRVLLKYANCPKTYAPSFEIYIKDLPQTIHEKF